MGIEDLFKTDHAWEGTEVYLSHMSAYSPTPDHLHEVSDNSSLQEITHAARSGVGVVKGVVIVETIDSSVIRPPRGGYSKGERAEMLFRG